MASSPPRFLRVHPEVAEASAAGAPVVALESTLVSHGLPRPDNLRVARELEEEVRAAGAVPATVAVLDGVARVGLDPEELAAVANRRDVVKVTTRDLAALVARGGSGATTVAATAHLAARAGVTVFATGGLGGVHRGARDSWDESADLTELSRTPVTVVCSGVKSLLDVAATVERLETLGVTVLGFGTDRFPGFYRRDSGLPLEWRVDTVEEVAAVERAGAALATNASALVVAHPVPVADELDGDLHDRVLAAGLAELERAGVGGKAVTPFLLDFFHRHTGGASLTCNVALVRANARLAGRIAVARAAPPRSV